MVHQVLVKAQVNLDAATIPVDNKTTQEIMMRTRQVQLDRGEEKDDKTLLCLSYYLLFYHKETSSLTILNESPTFFYITIALI